MKIISGGQIGADIAGLRAAKKLDYKTGGWMPKGFKTLDGPKPEYEELYGMIESSRSEYPQRTSLNVFTSHGTLRIARDFDTRGERCTLKAIQYYKRPYYDVHLDINFNYNEFVVKEITEFIIFNKIFILNIAGNAKIEIEETVENLLVDVFTTNSYRFQVAGIT